MATDDDAAKASRRKPGKRRSVKPRIDQAFADLIEPEELELADAQALEDGDLEFADGPGGFQTATYTQQYYLRTLPVAEDAIAAFAQEFAIERIGELRQVLALICREVDNTEPESGWVMLWRGEAWDVPEAYAAAYHQAIEYADGLLTLLSGPFWPVALDKQPGRARSTLVKYRCWLDEIKFGRRMRERGRPRWAKEERAAYVLAWAWPLLAEEEPYVVQVQNDEKKPDKSRERPLSRFNVAFLRACELLGLRKPSTKKLAQWLAVTEPARAAHHARLDQLYGDG